MPAHVTGEGEPYRPEMLVWMSSEGLVLGSDVGKPGAVLQRAAEHFRETTRQPLAGKAHVPARVRVASAELAAALEGALAGAEIVCAPTPELDELLAVMAETLGQGGKGATSYLTESVGETQVAAFFRALAAFHRAAPWNAVPADEALLVDIPALGMKQAAVTVVGQGGESFGFMVFDDGAAFDDFVEAAIEETPSGMPGHLAVNLLGLTELPDGLAEEVERYGWEIAGPEAVPWPVVLDDDLVPRPPTAAELHLAEAIALAVADLVRTTPDLARRWWKSPPFARTVTVTTHRGPIEVALAVPQEDAESLARPPFDAVAELVALEGHGDELDLDEVDRLSGQIVEEFEGSREANFLDEVPWCGALMDLAAAHLGVTIASLRPADLEVVLFEVIPRRVADTGPSDAHAIVEELRAFFGFLHRVYGLPHARSCLRVLGTGAENRLEAALGDTSKFGMAKALFAQGRASGFDMDSKEGIDAWMRSIQGQRFPDSIRLPGAPPRPPAARGAVAAGGARKKRNKAARKARKKNR